MPYFTFDSSEGFLVKPENVVKRIYTTRRKNNKTFMDQMHKLEISGMPKIICDHSPSILTEHLLELLPQKWQDLMEMAVVWWQNFANFYIRSVWRSFGAPTDRGVLGQC
jgi:uncharacterized protein (DUF2249 family)